MPTTFAVDELNFCVRYGNRWILIAIITGMAPLVGLEATVKFQKCLILAYFCPILPYFQQKIKPCAKRVPKHTTSDSDLNIAFKICAAESKRPPRRISYFTLNYLIYFTFLASPTRLSLPASTIFVSMRVAVADETFRNFSTSLRTISPFSTTNL